MSAHEIEEWVAKAESNLGLALSAEATEYADEICFLSQQCAEKLLKAALSQRHQIPPRTHDLIRLNDLIVATDDRFSVLYDALHILDPYAVQTRYPGSSASCHDAEEAREAAAFVRSEVRQLMGLDAEQPEREETPPDEQEQP